jgi:hypothetical protein
MRRSEPGYRAWFADECLAGRGTELLPRAHLPACRSATRSSEKCGSLRISAYGECLRAGGREQELIANS